MKKIINRIVTAMLIMGLVLNGSFITQTAKGAETNVKEIVIYHTNDMHGHLNEAIGIAKVATLKKTTENSLLLDGGDAVQGAPLATLSNGEDVIKLMNLAGYDAMCTGNHEFDYGQDQLLKLFSLAEYPILGANVKKGGEALLKGTYGEKKKQSNGQYALFEKAGVKIGVFGLTTQETRTSANPAGLTGITFEDEISTAKEMVNALEAEGADIIVCMAHIGEIDGTVCTSDMLAEAMTGEYQGKLDLIIDAHSHTVENKVVNGIQISQTGTALANVGKVTLKYDQETKDVDIEAELISEADFTAEDGKYKDVVPDSDVEAKLAEIEDASKELLQQKIADTDSTLWGGTINNVAEGRVTEINLGNLIADSMIDEGKYMISEGNVAEEYKNLPIVALQNGGGVRSTIHKGVITKGDIINVLPFGNGVLFKVVTPKVLYEAMEQGLSGNKGLTADGLMAGTTASGGFPQIGGMSLVYDPNKETGQKVEAIYLDGENTALDRNDESRQIILGSIDYLFSGGNNYTMLADPGLKQIAEGRSQDVLLENTILARTEKGTKALTLPVTENRIVVHSDAYTPKDYTACVEIHDTDGNIAADKEVEYYIDDSESKKGTTDENGLLEVTVSDGPHTVGLVNGQKEAYICNYTGTGIILNFTKTYPAITADFSEKEPEPTSSPEPTATPEPEQTAEPSAQPEETKEPEATEQPTPTEQPAPTGQPNPTEQPTAPSDKVVSGDNKVTAEAPSVPKVAKVRIKKNKAVIKIKKISDADGYQIKVGSNKKLSKNMKKLSGKKRTFVIKKWKKNKCFVKVRAYKLDSSGKRVYGKWSKVKIIKKSGKQ